MLNASVFHEPQRHGSRRSIGPEEINITIFIHIAHALYFPIGVDRVEGLNLLHRGNLVALHDPPEIGSGLGIAPQDIDLLVTIGICRPNYGPFRIGDRRQPNDASERRALGIHEPPEIFPGGLIAPKIVANAISVIVCDGDHAPVCIGYWG